MSSDPIGDLFADNAPVPVKTTATQANSGSLSNIVLICALCFLAFIAWQKYSESGHKEKRQDRQEERDQVKYDSGYLIFVHERRPLSEADAQILDIADDMHTVNSKLEWRSVDDDDTSKPVDDIKAFAKSKGIDAPFVVHKTSDGKLRKAISWPKTKEDLLKVLE